MSVKDALNGGSATKKEKATKKEAVEDKVKVEQETVEETAVEETVAEETATEETVAEETESEETKSETTVEENGKEDAATTETATEEKVEGVEEIAVEETATEEKIQETGETSTEDITEDGGEVVNDNSDEDVEVDNTLRLGPDGEVLTGVVPGSLTETLLGGDDSGNKGDETEEIVKENTEIKSSDVDIKSIIASRVITHSRPQTPLEELNSRRPGYKSVKEELVSRKRNLPGQRYQAGGRRGRKIQ